MLIIDLEVYHNLFLVGCWNPETDVFQFFQPDRLRQFQKYLEHHEPDIITFNGIHYDLRILKFAFAHLGETPERLMEKTKAFSDFIIDGKPDDPRKPYYNNFWWPGKRHIDLKNVLGGRLVPSLKKLSYRLQFPNLESLPVDPSKILTTEEIEKIIAYNKIDLTNTYELWKYCQPQLELRQNLTDMYKIDCMSLSDSQIAEKVIARDAPKQTAFDPKHPRSMNVFFDAKKYKFTNPSLLAFLDRLNKTKVQFKQTFDPLKQKPTFTRKFLEPQEGPQNALESTAIKIKGIEPPCDFAFGGIHSVHSKSIFGELAYDIDATSFYPNLILKHNIYPSGLGERFLHVYKEILEKRIKAKHDGDKIVADSLKIVLNSTFGKFNEYFSRLRDPISSVSVCLNGQLAILRLMDLCYEYGYKVLMVNTDGIVTQTYPREAIEKWTEEQGMSLEVRQIDRYFIQNSNNHIFRYSDREVKVKGAAFAFEKSVAKQNSYPIINRAIVANILDDVALEDTIINACTNIHDFLACYAKGYTIEQIKLSSSVEEEGRTCPSVSRYYMSTDSQEQIFKKNAKSWIKVPLTQGIKLLNVIESDELPSDLDVQRYIEEANIKLKKIRG
jgi:DNA polymerase elongation subunit (family B)